MLTLSMTKITNTTHQPDLFLQHGMGQHSVTGTEIVLELVEERLLSILAMCVVVMGPHVPRVSVPMELWIVRATVTAVPKLIPVMYVEGMDHHALARRETSTAKADVMVIVWSTNVEFVRATARRATLDSAHRAQLTVLENATAVLESMFVVSVAALRPKKTIVRKHIHALMPTQMASWSSIVRVSVTGLPRQISVVFVVEATKRASFVVMTWIAIVSAVELLK